MTGWPLFDLRLRLGELLLRPVTEADLPLLVSILPQDLELDPSLPEDRGLAVHQGYWRAQGHWSADDWALWFLVQSGEQVVGVQVLEGAQFPVLRTVDSSSWLVASARGRGIGKQMRRAVLDFAFGSLGAQAAITSAWHDNHASLGVSRALGYQPNGEHLQRRDAEADVMVHLRLLRAQWRDSAVVVDGLEECRHLFGA